MYNKREVMRAAHGFCKANNLTMTDALRAAWKGAKIEKLDTRICALSNADRYTATERKMNDELRAERNYLASQFAALVPPVRSEREMLLNLKEDMMREAFRNFDNATYYTLKAMNANEFAEYIKIADVA